MVLFNRTSRNSYFQISLMKKQITTQVDVFVKKYIVNKAKKMSRSESFVVSDLVEKGLQVDFLLKAMKHWPKGTSLPKVEIRPDGSIISSLKKLAVGYKEKGSDQFDGFIEFLNKHGQ